MAGVRFACGKPRVQTPAPPADTQLRGAMDSRASNLGVAGSSPSELRRPIQHTQGVYCVSSIMDGNALAEGARVTYLKVLMIGGARTARTRCAAASREQRGGGGFGGGGYGGGGGCSGVAGATMAAVAVAVRRRRRFLLSFRPREVPSSCTSLVLTLWVSTGGGGGGYGGAASSARGAPSSMAPS